MLKTVCLVVALGLTAVGFAKADKLDDIINRAGARNVDVLVFARVVAPARPPI